MIYNNQKLDHFFTEEATFFKPPKIMLVCNDPYNGVPIPAKVFAYIPQMNYPVITDVGNFILCSYPPKDAIDKILPFFNTKKSQNDTPKK